MRRAIVVLSATLLLSAAAASAQNDKPHNLILFVPDGLRGWIVKPETAPAMAESATRASISATRTRCSRPSPWPNASAMATGHYLGDTGDLQQHHLYRISGRPAGGTVTPFLENDPVIGDVDEHFAGNYLNEETILKRARARASAPPRSASSARR